MTLVIACSADDPGAAVAALGVAALQRLGAEVGPPVLAVQMRNQQTVRSKILPTSRHWTVAWGPGGASFDRHSYGRYIPSTGPTHDIEGGVNVMLLCDVKHNNMAHNSVARWASESVCTKCLN